MVYWLSSNNADASREAPLLPNFADNFDHTDVASLVEKFDKIQIGTD
jgi:hypothetical protein